MGNEQEHKEAGSVADTMEKFFEDREAEGGDPKPEVEAPPQKEESEEAPSGSVPPKTPKDGENPDDYKGVPEGFRNHPAWMSREQKLKETQGKLKELETSNSVYSRLLDDPLVYRKYLETQGFSKEEIGQALAERGIEDESPKQETPKDQSNAPGPYEIANKVCKNLGWDMSRLNQEQKDYLKDQILLTQELFNTFVGPALESRLKPVESFVREQAVNREVSRGYEEAKSLAKEEFPNLDWEKDIEPAMHKYLDDLDKRDPKGRIKIDTLTLYEKATRQILKEKKESVARQEDRNDLKKNARPLVPGSQAQRTGSPTKGKSVKETAENFLTSIGFKE